MSEVQWAAVRTILEEIKLPLQSHETPTLGFPGSKPTAAMCGNSSVSALLPPLNNLRVVRVHSDTLMGFRFNVGVGVTQWLWTWKSHTALSCVLVLILLGIIVFITVYFTRHPDAPTTPTTPSIPPTPTTTVSWEIPDSSTEGNNGTEFRIVERDEWGARPPLVSLKEMKLPVSYVIICHTATFCTTLPECAHIVRFVQDYYMENDIADIIYNFLVGGDGFAYVGRSWNHTGAHTGLYNDISIGIAFIGDFTSVVPPKTQLNAAKELIKFGVRAGKIAPDYKLFGHRQFRNITSPGDALYNEIKKWPHWSPHFLISLYKASPGLV
ncbi:peptidoglycan-recognition protein SD-like [Temnothorax longispinosus]|uniref:peptidoglycan-recognition protein SD-like n=1 Tax=Temnothorax longispinosus TaxID=300112 RepID=UPI003A99D1A3